MAASVKGTFSIGGCRWSSTGDCEGKVVSEGEVGEDDGVEERGRDNIGGNSGAGSPASFAASMAFSWSSIRW